MRSLPFGESFMREFTMQRLTLPREILAVGPSNYRLHESKQDAPGCVGAAQSIPHRLERRDKATQFVRTLEGLGLTDCQLAAEGQGRLTSAAGES